jgi:thiol-disulfide isomerase/thioredoxin
MKKIFLRFALLLLAAPLQAIPAPDFTITTTDGVQRHLYADYLNQGKVVVIEIFFTTCPPCATHAPHWQSLYQNMQAAYPGQVEFFILSNLASDNNLKVAQYRTSKGLTMPGAGSDGGSLTALQPYLNDQFGQFLGTPTFIVLAPGTGEVFFDIRGSSPANTMTLLSQKIAQVVPPECTLESYDDLPVSPVQLRVQTAAGLDTTITAAGGYGLGAIPALQNATYTISPRKTDNLLDGVTTYDLVLISRHILGLEPFQHDWQVQAADVNASGFVTTFDIVHTRKVILGILDTFAGGLSWEFVPESATASNGGCADFRGIKLGDVNGPLAVPDDRDGEAWPVTFHGPGRYAAGRTYRVEFRAGVSLDLSALQLELGFDSRTLELLALESPLPGFDADCYNFLEAGRAPLSWHSAKPVGLASGQVLLAATLRCRGEQGDAALFHLSPDGLPALAWDAAGQAHALELELKTEETASPELPIRVSSNPGRSGFTVTFLQEREGAVSLQLLDLRGTPAWEEKVAVQTGENRLTLQPGLPAGGTYFLLVDGRPAGPVVLTPGR